MSGEDRERRIGPEDVERYFREHDREIRAGLEAEMAATAELIGARPRPAWAEPTMRVDIGQVTEMAEELRRDQRPRRWLAEIHSDQFADIAERVRRAGGTPVPLPPYPLVGMRVVSELPPATPRADLLGRIDDVLTNWTGSPDAASWHPEGVYPHPIGPRRPQAAPRQGLSPAQLHTITAVAEGLVESLQAFVVGAAETITQIVGTLRELGYRVDPPTPAEDPRERALQARRQRNTGPPGPRLDGRRR